MNNAPIKGVTVQVLPIDPIERVTGSCYLLRWVERDLRLLVDCGAYQGGPDAAQLDAAPFGFDPTRIHAVLLTHGHYDHCGRLPQLVRDGFRGRVIATEETIRIARIVLEDAQKHRGDPTLKAAYGQILWQAIGSQHLFKSPLPVATDVVVFAHRSAHIIGAVSFELAIGPVERRSEQVRVLFSGDVGNNRDSMQPQPFLGKAMHPLSTVDLAFLESTYGNVRRTGAGVDAQVRRNALAQELRRAFVRGGPTIVPVFNIERAQDVLYDLHLLAVDDPALLDHIPIVVDAPMALRFNDVLRDALARVFVSARGKVRPTWLGKQSVRDLGLDPEVPSQLQLAVQQLAAVYAAPQAWSPGPPLQSEVATASRAERFRPRWTSVGHAQRSAAIAEAGPRVVLAGGGTADHGPVLSWLAHWLEDPRATVMFAGHCVRGTLGGKLLDLGRLDPQERAFLRERLPALDREILGCDVAAKILSLSGYSAHADQDGLVSWAFPTKDGQQFPVAKHVVITHGDAMQRRGLKQALDERAIALQLAMRVLLPAAGGDGLDARTGASVPREQILGIQPQADPTLLAKLVALAPAERERLIAMLRGA